MKTATDQLIAASHRFGFKLFAKPVKQQPNPLEESTDVQVMCKWRSL
ncbi:MAG: hypothetical protein KME12_15665 [Trichocoleus desertorum ATA4-8-CV12]|nr:hypothetical protein [Trichocoleus desertorum ATA4-8-CV12]